MGLIPKRLAAAVVRIIGIFGLYQLVAMLLGMLRCNLHWPMQWTYAVAHDPIATRAPR